MMKIKLNAAIALATCGFSVLALSGCGTASTAHTSSPPATSTSINGPNQEGSASRHYASLADVASYSTDLVEGVVTGEQEVVPAALDPAPDDKAQSTISSVKITQVLGGDSFKPGDTILVRQLGTGAAPVDNILLPDQTYALYVEPFYFVEGTSTGQYVIVGDTSIAMAATKRTGIVKLNRGPATSVGLTALRATVSSLGTKARPNGLARKVAKTALRVAGRGNLPDHIYISRGWSRSG